MNISLLYHRFLETGKICTDTRKDVAGSMFFCLKGENFDGNRYAKEALSQGAAFVVTGDASLSGNPRCLFVKDTLLALQELASFHRARISAVVIAITGTNGKTTTKELVSRVLARKFNTVHTTGNLNNHIGVPLTLLDIQKETEMAVIEMGANHPGEIGGLCRIAAPRFGMITNIGKAHLEGFGSYEGVIRAKSELYDYLKETKGTIFLNTGHPVLVSRAGNATAVTYGTSGSFCNGKITGSFPYLSVEYSHKGEKHPISTRLTGAYNLENVLAALCVGLYFGVSAEDLSGAISSYIPSNNRSQFLDTGNNRVILDAYNANPSSMKAALDHFASMPARNKIVILGDMFELGETSDQEHTELLETALNMNFSGVICVGPRLLAAGKGKNIRCFETTEELASWLRINPVRGAHLLVKGSRKMQLEKITEFL